jgi:SH3-like domain-containing protein
MKATLRLFFLMSIFFSISRSNAELSDNKESDNSLKLGIFPTKDPSLIPRFVSVKSNEVNMRAGPDENSEIIWIFVQKGEPLEVIEEYGQWRKVRDVKSDGGWVRSGVLSPKRTVVIIHEESVPITKTEDADSKVFARAMPEVRCSLLKCLKDRCKVKCKEYKGWIDKKFMWGVYDKD